MNERNSLYFSVIKNWLWQVLRLLFQPFWFYHANTPIRMFHVKWRRRCLISKSPFSRQCVGRIRDTCSQLTWKSHSPYTHGGTFWPTLTPAQTLYLHESSCINKPKSEVCKKATSPFDMSVASSSVVFMIHAASWYETYAHTHAQTHFLQFVTQIISFRECFFRHWIQHKCNCIVICRVEPR